MFTKRDLCITLLLAALALALPAFAQTPINLGDSITGEADGTPIDYVIALETGQAITIDLVSDAFDAFLFVLDANGNEINSNDDGGDGTNSQLTFAAPTGGDYIIRATSFNGTPSGSFILSVSPAAEAQQIAVGERVEGQFTEELIFSVDLSAEQCVTIQFGAPQGGFDARLIGFDPSGVQVFEDDDDGVGPNAYEDFCAMQTGTHRIIATAFGSDVSGPFIFEIGQSTPFTVTTPDGAESNGETIAATLTESTADYTVTLAAGQEIQVNVNSDDFDTYAGLIGPDGADLGGDDDGGEDTNSQFFYRAEAPGTYTVQVTSYANAGSGEYTITIVEPVPLLPFESANDDAPVIEAGVGPTTTNMGTIEQGQQVTGTIEVGERQLYTVSVQSDTTLTITLESDDFDAYLRLNQFSFELTNDDNSLSFNNAQIIYTLEFAGEYQITVGSWDDGEGGSYTLTVE